MLLEHIEFVNSHLIDLVTKLYLQSMHSNMCFSIPGVPEEFVKYYSVYSKKKF